MRFNIPPHGSDSTPCNEPVMMGSKINIRTSFHSSEMSFDIGSFSESDRIALTQLTTPTRLLLVDYSLSINESKPVNASFSDLNYYANFCFRSKF